MKHMYQPNIKPFLQEQIMKAAEEQGLSKEKASELLGIDSRSYAYLKSGRNMCSATTLLMFITKMCPDPMAFVESARKVVTEAEESLF